MDKRNIASVSISVSDAMEKLKLDDSVDEDDFEYDSEDDSEDYFEDDEEMEDNLHSEPVNEKDGLNAIAKWSISNEINPKTIKKSFFVEFMRRRLRNADLRLLVPRVEEEVLEIHKECEEKAKKFLKDFQGKITLSYEWMRLGWTRDQIKGPILHEDFTCMAAHFIDDNWKVRKWILGYTTDESIALDHFRTALQGFEIENKVSSILLPDHEEFDDNTVDAIRKCIDEKGNHKITPPVFQIYCCADLFRLMVGDLYNELSSSLLDVVRMFVGWGRGSSTNWNVKLSHMQHVVYMKTKDVFSSKDKIYDYYRKPSAEEWIKIETFCKLAGRIYKVANVLFEGDYSTSNLYFHLLAELKFMLNQELKSGDNDDFLGKGKEIMERFDKYWNDMFLVLATASVLDPRFKMKYIEFYCSKSKDNDEGSKAESVLDYLRNLCACYAASDIGPICPDPTINYEEGEEEEDEEEEDVDDNEEQDYWEEEKERQEQEDKEKNKPDAYKDFVLFQEFLKFEGCSREFQESELDSYLKEPVMEWNKDFKVLEWWKEESQKYPILSRVARDILSIPISRATSSDVYVPDKREPPEFVVSMDPKVANAMMCSKSCLP